eukprot:CAMPEP_0185020046 /NCGR_PEP_ID=MMETSP1103-20130426/2634_1 /TAXON_ID=36769 /ORGANISM="Paraphysomonas bandaiensis, Strain Caron Lab Isolate" /LENGTH=750 /DNA_ID=CAMNT_0027550689 /DNA_START=247 /DNA_END=2499 /DNA_ORIENTATION=-
MFLIGGVLAAIVDNCDAGHLGESINSWKKLDPEMMLFLFLPVLIFGEAMTLKWHHVKGGLPQALLLAGPGVIIGAFIMGTFVFVLPLDWSWNLSMVFGSILAATDPVAVVALLKSAGASPKLTILIIGESLLNDGTAMVLFSLFFDMCKGEEYGAGGIVLYFLKMAVGSPLFGATIGLASVYCMSKANKPLSGDDVTVQIAITICCAYMTFFMAEYECRMSGLLACCGAGAVFSWLAPPLILEHETMHHVWSIIEWAGNTLIFLLAGLIIGSETIKEVTASDWGYLILLYLFLSVLRCFIIAILFPVLSNVGLKCSREDACFMAWAGLRGALGMALALIVQGDRSESDLSKKDTDRVFFFVGGIAALTLIVNATTSRRVLNSLGLLKQDTPDKVLVMEQIRKRLRARLLAEVKQLQKRLRIEDANDIIKHNTMLLEEARESMAMKDDSGGRRFSSTASLNDRTLSKRNSQSDLMSDLLAYVRTVFLEIVRVEYWRRIEDGRLPREANATQTLLYSIDNALDRVHKTRLRDWKWLKREMVMSPTLVWFGAMLQQWSYPTSTLHSLLDILESRNEELRVHVLTHFIEAHESAQKKIFRFMGEEDGENDESFRTPETSVVLRESQNSVQEAKKMLGTIDRYVINSIVCRQAGRSLLSKQVELVTDMVQEGLMAPQDTEKFFNLVKHDLERLEELTTREFRDHVRLTQSKRITASMSATSTLYRHDLTAAAAYVPPTLTEALLSEDSDDPDEDD